MKAAIIAAPMTGSGKSTVTLGLLSALRRRGHSVQSFKVGPDFIDTGLHELATGTPSHNLDGWMLDRQTNVDLFAAATVGKDVALVEGVMGLFDGAAGSSDSGSTAEMARWLDLPIILVLDANPLARTAAAIIHGLRTFDSTLEFAGVIFNRVAGEGHFRILKDAVNDLPVLGWLPSNTEIEIRERHLGLLTRHEEEAKTRVNRLAEFVSAHLDIDQILAVLKPLHSVHSLIVDRRLQPPEPRPRKRVAIAHDRAFSFYYHANRSALVESGAEIVEFSPLNDACVPDADLLYIGGGYPELYRKELESNREMRKSIRHFIESGKKFYAECGGLMYLSKHIEGSEMVGILPTEIHLSDRPVDFGYTEVTTLHESIFGKAGTRLRGHQFHFSKCLPTSTCPAYRVKQGTRDYDEGWLLPNGIASYVHLHFLSNQDVVRHLLES